MTPPSGIDRREAIRRVSVVLGGVALVGGDALFAACGRERPANERIGDFSTEDIAFLDEVAETILPETDTPGAKAARTGAFMALMVTDVYKPSDQQVFRNGMRQVDEASRRSYGVSFMGASPQQRLRVLEVLDREQKSHMDRRTPARVVPRRRPEAYLPDQRREAAPGTDVSAAAAITADAPAHYFRMMKELALLGYFTSEIGYKQAQRYAETPGRFDPCIPYQTGDRSWAPHA